MELTKRQLFLIHYIASGYLFPVNKLINEEEFNEILDEYTFKKECYSLPYLFQVNSFNIFEMTKCYFNGIFVCNIEVESIFKINKVVSSAKIFETTDLNHPGVQDFMNEGDSYLSGWIRNYSSTALDLLNIPYVNPPNQMEYVFQSRNPPHKAHEHIIKQYAGNLIYTTPYETTNSNDYEFKLKMKCYEIMKKKYNVNIFVTLLPRVFAGPREALQNVILFRNLGSNNFIMGRGKNCYGDYYDEHEPIRLCNIKYSETNMNIIEEQTYYVNGEVLRASDIKTKYINNGLKIPTEIMSEDISGILYD
jgi:sulfate adenylyltransferase